MCIYEKFQFPIFHYPLPVSLPGHHHHHRPKFNFLQSHHLIMIYGNFDFEAKNIHMHDLIIIVGAKTAEKNQFLMLKFLRRNSELDHKKQKSENQFLEIHKNITATNSLLA